MVHKNIYSYALIVIVVYESLSWPLKTSYSHCWKNSNIEHDGKPRLQDLNEFMSKLLGSFPSQDRSGTIMENLELSGNFKISNLKTSHGY